MEINYEVNYCCLCNKEYVRIIDSQGRSSLICSNCRSLLPLPSEQQSYIANNLKKLNFSYIKQKENEKKKYRKTLIYGIIFMILFTISIIFLWNCTPNQDEIFAYDWNQSEVITDWDCQEMERGL